MDLRATWNDENEREFNHDSSINYIKCPNCEFEFYLEEQKDLFNKRKSENLENIQKKADKIIKQNEDDEKKLLELEKKINAITKDQKETEKKLLHLKTDIENVEKKVIPNKDDKKYMDLAVQETKLQGQLQEMELGNTSKEIDEINNKITSLENQISIFEEQKAALVIQDEIKTRIVELNSEEKLLSKEYEGVVSKLALIDEFIREKISLIEDRVNNRFTKTRFNLFKKNLGNDDVVEICDVTDIKGAPFVKGGLSTSEKFDIGFDIINTLSESEFYGITTPIFIDNAESITHEIKSNSQLICLYANREEKSLKYITEGE
jgi:hypothetical protein